MRGWSTGTALIRVGCNSASRILYQPLVKFFEPDHERCCHQFDHRTTPRIESEPAKLMVSFRRMLRVG